MPYSCLTLFRRERNRIASAKSRKKKTDKIKDLEEQLAKLKTDKDILLRQLTELTQEVMRTAGKNNVETIAFQ